MVSIFHGLDTPRAGMQEVWSEHWTLGLGVFTGLNPSCNIAVMPSNKALHICGSHEN